MGGCCYKWLYLPPASSSLFDRRIDTNVEQELTEGTETVGTTLSRVRLWFQVGGYGLQGAKPKSGGD